MDIRDDDSGMTYTPHTGPNGEVGFKCTRDDGGVTYITLNPSVGATTGCRPCSCTSATRATCCTTRPRTSTT
jgi:hypothetical protein